MFDPEHVAPERIRGLARVEYDRLVELGMFEDERVELLRGVLVTMSPQGAPHILVTAWFHEELVRALERSFLVCSHSPLAASEDSEPEPDVSVCKRPLGVELPSSPLLLIEVSDSSLRKDRRIKTSIYAEAGCPECWIVNISGAELMVEVYRDPRDGVYQHVETLRVGDVLRPVALPDVELRIADIPWR